MPRDSDHKLSLEFMRSHPAQAARVLESLPAEDAVEMFGYAPARLADSVLTNMLPNKAANCLALLDEERALELLAPMGTQPCVSILRYMPETRRRAMIAGLPTAVSVASSLLLGYADDTVGAWVDPDVTMMSVDTRVGQALDRLRMGESRECALLFVIDTKAHLVGQASINALLKANDEVTLGAIMQRSGFTLMAHAPLAATPAHPGWESGFMLPVVERDGRLIGMMTRDSLTRALRRTTSSTDNVVEHASLSQLFALGYWHALSGLLEGALTILPKVSPILEKNDER